MQDRSDAPPLPDRTLVWVPHVAVWVLAVLSARLAIVNAKIDMHITGRARAELAPEHLREILGAPTKEFQILALFGTSASLGLAILLRGSGPKWLWWLTLGASLVAAWCYLLGYVLGASIAAASPRRERSGEQGNAIT